MKKRLRCRLLAEQLESRCLLDVQSFDGFGNNLADPTLGMAGTDLLRVTPAAYADGLSTPAGANRPSAREISNLLSQHGDANLPNERNLSAWVYIWGQFIDHDMDLTGPDPSAEQFPIQVPTGDPSFDPDGTGGVTIPLTRSIYDPATGTFDPRQQVNQITSFLDGSMIYGSDQGRDAALREFVGGRLLESADGLPPLNVNGLPNANDAGLFDDAELFLAGDVRSNENIELTAITTLFIREHNRMANWESRSDPTASDEVIFQRARQWVIWEIQHITYDEWLPALLGQNALKPYTGYDGRVNPSIMTEFSSSAFRLHTMVNDDVEFFDDNGNPIPFSYVDPFGETQSVDGQVSLASAFFNPGLVEQAPIDGIYKYAASTLAEKVDLKIVDPLRDELFGPPGAGGLDLVALNIQRGRDNGLADYNTTRATFGLPRVTSFAQITSNVQLQKDLKKLYGNVNNIDAFVGEMAEDHVAGAAVGPLLKAIYVNQFTRLRDGDRFFYDATAQPWQQFYLRDWSLSQIIKFDTGVTNIQDNAFVFTGTVKGKVFVDTNRSGTLSAGEFGLRGAIVSLINSDGTTIATTTTNTTGNFSFKVPETGNYTISVQAGKGKSAVRQFATANVDSGGTADVENVAFPRSARTVFVGSSLFKYWNFV